MEKGEVPEYGGRRESRPRVERSFFIVLCGSPCCIDGRLRFVRGAWVLEVGDGYSYI